MFFSIIVLLYEIRGGSRAGFGGPSVSFYCLLIWDVSKHNCFTI